MMRAIGLDYERKQLVETRIPAPERRGSDEVLFRVHEVGVCGTDRELAAFRLGYPPAGESFLVLGHEALGRVEEVGTGVRGLQRGDWVVPMIRRACSPPCPSCARGRRDLCVSGRAPERGIFGWHGYFTEWAVDRAEDLVAIPAELAECAVLLEPLSVVEKAIERALRLAETPPATALVLGAGPIGLLAALCLLHRGLRVWLHSLETPDHPRVRLAESAGIAYVAQPEHKADLIVEATGSAEAAFAALQWLAPAGVCALLGAPNAAGPMPFLDMIVKNQVVFGSVNAAPQSFQSAVEDLQRFDRRLLRAMIHRVPASAFRQTIPDPAPRAAKTVHVLAD